MSVERLDAFIAQAVSRGELTESDAKKLARGKKRKGSVLGRWLDRGEVDALRQLKQRIDSGDIRAHSAVEKQVDTLVTNGHDSWMTRVGRTALPEVGIAVSVANLSATLSGFAAFKFGIKGLALAASAVIGTMWAYPLAVLGAAAAWVTKRVVED